MSERYWITGAQLGCLAAFPEKIERKELVKKIINKQFIGNCENLEEQKKFRQIMEEITKKGSGNE